MNNYIVVKSKMAVAHEDGRQPVRINPFPIFFSGILMRTARGFRRRDGGEWERQAEEEEVRDIHARAVGLDRLRTACGKAAQHFSDLASSHHVRYACEWRLGHTCFGISISLMLRKTAPGYWILCLCGTSR